MHKCLIVLNIFIIPFLYWGHWSAIQGGSVDDRELSSAGAAVIPGPASGLIIGGNNSIIIIVMIIANNDYPNIASSLLLLSCYKTCERPNYRKPLCLKGIIVSLKLISDIAYYYGCQVSSVIPNSENGLIIALPAFMVSLNRPTAL